MNPSFSRVILVGCGGIARAHAGAIGAANIVALCDSDGEAAHRLQGELATATPIYGDFAEALQRCRADAAILCTPPTTHAALARAVLESGVAVLCEKPLATHAADAQMLIELAEARAVKLRTSAKYRFARGAAVAKDWPELGELERVEIAFGAPFDYARSWHSRRELSGGGVWMDNGPHALDLARFFAGELTMCAIEKWDGPLETEVGVKLRGATGIAVQIDLSWLRNLGDWFAVLQGAGGTLKIGWRETQWHPQRGKASVVAGGYDKGACFAQQWRDFGGDSAQWQATDGARVVEILEAVYQAARAI